VEVEARPPTTDLDATAQGEPGTEGASEGLADEIRAGDRAGQTAGTPTRRVLAGTAAESCLTFASSNEDTWRPQC
jgi:hypothetical protein